MSSKAHLLAAGSSMTICLEIVTAHTLPYTLATTFQKDGALFAAIRRWRCEAARHWCKTPLLHIRFNENKSHLTKVDVHLARSVGANRREEVLRLQAVCDIV
jgi:hypothetical protein